MAAEKNTVAIIGAGTMGSGIAQVAAMHGWTVLLRDVNDETVNNAIGGIVRRLDRLVEKGRIDDDQRDAMAGRLHVASNIDMVTPASLVIEAIVENLDTKKRVLERLVPVLDPQAIIATNTSSLSITSIGEAIGQSARTVGMHFFNPAPLMPLVEVIRGRSTDDDVVNQVMRIARDWEKTPVRVRDTPGFIVNRVARPFYLESWRVLADGLAGVDEIDRIMRDFGNFRMGPFELTDLIGQDVNTATTESVWQQLGNPSRLAPSPMQAQLVADGHLGRKTGRGAYRYDGESPVPAIEVERQPLVASDTLLDAVSAFVERATDKRGTDLEHAIFARVLVSIINEAAWTLADDVASEDDIDTAMKLGTNYPRGPLEWSASIGHDRCAALLATLAEQPDGQRFNAPASLSVPV